MVTTKQKILNKSLKLFNDQGVTKVSLRAIASEVGISVGNLQYHFKKREDIIEELYFQLVEKLDAIFLMSKEDLLPLFFTLSKSIIEILYEYNFFLLDFVAITRKNQKIKKHYSELFKRREAETLNMVSFLINNNLFREELIKNEYRNLFKRIEIISNFWFSSVLIQADNLNKDSIEEYSLLIRQSIYPYLTPEGKKQYFNLFPDDYFSC